MLTLNNDATEAIEQILANPEVPGGAGIRIAATGRSSNGSGPEANALQIMVAAQPATTDEVIEEEGIRVFLDDDVSEFLADKLLDVAVEGENVQFTLGEL